MPYFNVKDSAPITYQENGIRKIYNFVAGNSGYDNHLLYTDYWDGTQWQPADLGLSGTFPISSFRPAAITYQEGRVQKIYNFIYRSDNHVWVNWWDGSQWQWADLGSPGSPIITDLSAITFEEAGIRKLYVFAVGANNHLWINWWNGSQWQWTDQGSPGTQLIGRPAVITYSEGGRQKIYVFASGDNNHLNVYFWDGIRWQWADQGDTGTRQEISAITYEEGGVRKIYVFALGADNHLRINWWDGSQWRWADQGLSGPTGIPNSLSAITYVDGGVQKIYAFTVGADNHLHIHLWDGSQWQWSDQGTPGVAVVQPAALSYEEGGIQKIIVFLTGIDHLPYAYRWNGSQWMWQPFRHR